MKIYRTLQFHTCENDKSSQAKILGRTYIHLDVIIIVHSMHMDTQICPKCSKAVASVTDGSWCCHVTSLTRIIIHEIINRQMNGKTPGQKGHGPSFRVRLRRRLSYPASAGDASAPIHGSLCCHVTVPGRSSPP